MSDKSSYIIISEHSEPLVSVIIPVYNVAAYLRESLDSVVAQTYKNLEIIIIDDGSTDGSGDICGEYEHDPRVKLIHQENRGLSNARNIGLDIVHGEYIAFLDPDDAYHQDFIRLMLDKIQKEKTSIVVCKFAVYETDGEIRVDDNKKMIPLLAEGKYNGVEALNALADSKLNTSVWNKLYSSMLWADTRFPDGHNYEDLDTIFRILDKCDTLYVIDKQLYLHRKHSGSISQTYSSDNINDRNLAYSHLLSYIQANTPEIFSNSQLNKNRENYLRGMMIQYVNLRPAEGRSFREKLRTDIIVLGKEYGVENFSLKTKTEYTILRFCPWLLNIIFNIYYFLKWVYKKIFRR